ncbi:MAG TPA: response regulator [Gemmatimonadaceae bacterium]|jgi:DNA-binding NtrC family response regulator|nr:response regulator [Gemmatimonadaceae bacterium]
MSRRVLIVDDDRHMVRTLTDIVRLEGWNPDGAHSGEEAVEAVRKQPYQVVLMDVKMAGINGVDAFKAMKAMRPEIKVILMTAYTAADIIADAERAGALKVLSKPVVLSGLLEMLEQTHEEQKPVLVVADDAEFLANLSELLTEKGYLTLVAESLNHALVTLEEKAPAAVVLDLRLDGIKSEDSVVAIRRVSPGVALILCNGHTCKPDHPELLEGRLINASLQKPFPPARLIEILDEFFAA